MNIPTELFADDALLHYQADKDNSLTSSAVIQAAVSDAEAWALYLGKPGKVQPG